MSILPMMAHGHPGKKIVHAILFFGGRTTRRCIRR
jgi:hypothetical protein